MGRPSLVKQVEWAFQALDNLGQSKYAIKRSGARPTGIHSGCTMKNYISLCCTFAKWAGKEYGVRYLAELKPAMGDAYMKKLTADGKTASTLKTVASALRKLQVAIKARFGLNIKVVPEGITLPCRKLSERLGRFAYTPEQAQRIIDAARELDDQTADALELIYRFGLRLTCVVNLRAQDVRWGNLSLQVYRGKGGRRRQIPFNNSDDTQYLAQLIAGKEDMDLIFPGLKRARLQYVMKKACLAAGIDVHKVHNLRHSYSVRRYSQARANGVADKQARAQVSRELGHNRRSVTYAYIPPMIRPK